MQHFVEFCKWFFGQSLKADGFQLHWNTLPPRSRYFGFKRDWYDGPMYCFSLYYWHMTFIPSGSDLSRLYQLEDALEDAVKVNPEIHLLSSDEIVRRYAQKYINDQKYAEEKKDV